MALNACCQLSRCALRGVLNTHGAVRALASGSRCLYRQAGGGTDRQAGGGTDRQAGGRTDRQAGGGTDRQAGGRTGPWTRGFSSADQPAVSAAYEQVKKLLVARSGVLIDVREPWELREYGSIPGSVNVPLGQVSVALQLKPEEFKERYGGEMPLIGDHLVFTCLAGVRSQKALEVAQSLGYSNVQHYPGGWQDWAKHEILQMKA